MKKIDFLKDILRRHKKLFLWLFLVYLLLFISFVITSQLNTIIFSVLSLIFVTIIILSVKEFTIYCSNNAGVFTLVAVLLALIIFLCGLYEEKKEYKEKIENILLTENDINIDLATTTMREFEKVRKGEISVPDSVYFNKFHPLPYQENWDYIQKNYSKDCIKLYIKAVRNMEAANSLIEAMQYINLFDVWLPQELQVEVQEKFFKYKNLLMHQSCKIREQLERAKSGDCLTRNIECPPEY